MRNCENVIAVHTHIHTTLNNSVIVFHAQDKIVKRAKLT